MDDSSSGNLIHFNVSPVRKFVPLVPIPTEPSFLPSVESSPFDSTEAASMSEDPFELVLSSVTKLQRMEVLGKSREAHGPSNSSESRGEVELSYTASGELGCQCESLVQVPTIGGVGNFICDESITCLMDISDPTCASGTTEVIKSPVMDGEIKIGNSSLKHSANTGDQNENIASEEKDITSLVNEKLNNCIQLVLNGSCSLSQLGSGTSAGLSRRSFADLRLVGDEFVGAESTHMPFSQRRRSLDVSLDSAVKHSQQKVLHPCSVDDGFVSVIGTRSCDAITAIVNNRAFLHTASSSITGTAGQDSWESTTSVLNRAFLHNSSSNFTGITQQDSRASSSVSMLASGCGSMVSNILVGRWLESAKGMMSSCSDDSRSPLLDSCLPPSPAKTAPELNRSTFSSVFTSPQSTKDVYGVPGGGGTDNSQDGSGRILKDMDLISPEDHLAHEAQKIARSISDSVVGNQCETLDDIDIDLCSSDDDDSEHSIKLQKNEKNDCVSLHELEAWPLPLDMERLSAMSLHRSPVLPPPLLDQSRLLMRLKQLKAANHLPEGPDKKNAPLKAVIPLADMSKATGQGVCVPASNQAALQPSLPAVFYRNKTEETARELTALNSSKQQENSASSSKQKLRKRMDVKPQLLLHSKYGLPVPNRSPLLNGSSRTAQLTGPAHVPITSTPIRSETQGTSVCRVSPSVTPVTGGKLLTRRASTTRRSKENVGKLYDDTAAKCSRSTSVTPMKSVENQITRVGGSERLGQKVRSLDKVPVYAKKKSVLHAVRNKENILAT